jgi:cyclopropane-fatty-acyl-phospholipid synthase
MGAMARKIVTDTLSRAGIRINGSNPWDVRVNDDRFFSRALRGSLGFGESYMDGDWDADELDALFRRVMRMKLTRSPLVIVNRIWSDIRARLTNLQTRSGSRAIAEAHYDLDHRLYKEFLGPYNQYTCCFFNKAKTLQTAEIEKLEMLCNKLGLSAGDKVLDIGCGWGGFAKYAAETRGCSVTGVSISTEQIAYAREYTSGLPVKIIEADYRDLPEMYGGQHFDKVLICGMLEHVGYKNYRNIFSIIHHLLKDEGKFLLHTIGNNQTTAVVDPWIEKYIFRNSMAPAMGQLAEAFEGLLVVQDWENYGLYYAPTLAAWQQNFEKNWETISAIETERPFDERFRRMFNYYFLSCKAAFETENLHLWHVVLTKHGLGRQVYPRVNLKAKA